MTENSSTKMSVQRSKVRALFIIDFIFDITGGTENQVVKILTNLDRERHDVYLLCMHDTSWIREHASSLNCTVRSFNYNVFNHKDLRNIFALIRMYKYIKEIQPEIVITFFKTSYIAGVLLSRLAGVRSIISTRRDFGLWLDKRSLHLLRLANRFVAKIITNARVIRDLVVKEEGFDPASIDVVYNGIDMKDFLKDAAAGRKLKEELHIPMESPVVGIVAGLRPMKRHATLLRAAKKVLGERNDVHFVIVGDGPLRQDLEFLSQKLAINNSVHFVGWQKDVRSALSFFDIGVNCSANEGLSNAIMEYMAQGVACIAAAAGGNPELIEHSVNGLIFQLDNDEQLAQSITWLLTDSMKRQALADEAQRSIRSKFSIPEMIAAYERHFAELCGSRLGSQAR